MAYILNIETATKNCSVSVSENGKTIALKELNDGSYSHAEKLHEFIKEAVTKAGIEFSNLNAVAVSKGPGSYTGLRIGVSAAKGLCFALNIPLLSVNTLASLANSIKVETGLKIPLLDARRMEVYTAVFDEKNEVVKEVTARVIDESSFADFLNKERVTFAGDGAEKCKNIIKHPNAFFIDGLYPSAKEIGLLSHKKYLQKDFEDVAYFEPYYLKDFIVTKSKKA